ncbi:MAG: autotransporter adhesin family protein [Treponema sp.]|jgi:hypothetical protein|nr:autotransporter adhesin family protein [Treponema sp.]
MKSCGLKLKRGAPALAVVVALFLWTGCASAPVADTDAYYVSANGDDSQDGLTEERAFKTLKKALDAARGEGARKVIIVAGTLTMDSEGAAEGASVFDIRNTGDEAVTIRGKAGAKLSAFNTGKRVIQLFGNARIRLEDIEVSGGRIADQDIVKGGGGGALVVNGAALIAGKGAVIRGNQAQAGGGVAVGNRGSSFTLDGGEVRENGSATDGGGILAIAEGAVNIAAGSVAGNTAAAQGGGLSVQTGATASIAGGDISGNKASDGGGLHITGVAAMQGGRIRGNLAADSGGGAYIVGKGAFTLRGGEILDNHAPLSGGGVAVYDGGFVMQDGNVSGNAASSDTGAGGGVFVIQGSFEFSGGRIAGNVANNSGGGVNANHGSVFVMSGGEIAGNRSVYGGSGVAVLGDGNSFTKTGGIIYGLDAEEDLRNFNTEGGNSVDVTRNTDLRVALITEIKRRRNTTGEAVRLDSSKNGAEGGWEL